MARPTPFLLHRRRLALGLCALALSGCGFKLKSQHESIRFERAMIISSGNSPAALALSSQLRRELATRHGVTLVPQRTDAQVIVLLDEMRQDRVVVGFSSAGRPREIEIRIQLLLRIEDAQGTLLQPASAMEIRRTIAISDTEVLSADEAERFQIDTMIRDLLQQILRRLERLQGYAASPRPA